VEFEAGPCCFWICVLVSWVAAIWLAWSKSSGLLTGERVPPKPLDVVTGSVFCSGAVGVACFSDLSIGLAISSKEELSSSESTSSLSSVNLDARSLIEAVC